MADPRTRGRPRGRATLAGSALPLAAVLVLLVISGGASNGPTLRLRPLPAPSVSAQVAIATPPASLTPTEAPTAIGSPARPSGFANRLKGGLFAVLLVLVVTLLLLRNGGLSLGTPYGGFHRLRRGIRPSTPVCRPASSVATRLDAELGAGIAELDDSADPRAAVIACWRRLELAAAERGTPHEPSDSPSELVGRLLRAHAVSASSLRRLTGLYHEARFSTHPIDERMRQAAVAALTRIRTELRPDAATTAAVAPAQASGSR